MKNNLLKKSLIVGAISALALFGYAEQEKVIRIFSGGNVINEYKATDIDYIQVDDLINAPENVNATVSANAITIKWSAVEGATYSVFRSPDNVNFVCIAKDLTETTYTDTKPLQGSNYYRVKATVNGEESGYTTSVAATLPDNGMESGIYLGIYGFNQSVYEYPVQHLDESSITGFNEFIDNLTMKNGTLLYYSVEQALDDMQTTEFPSDIANVALVTFTDGLDQGSMMKNDTYEDDIEYLDALNHRITTQTVAGKPISAYSIGVRGSDVADISLFKENLQKLASTPENATEVTSMSEVNAKFQDIAQQLSKSNYVQTINLKMPGVSNGTLVRFTFDNVNNAANSSLYIEGNFNLKNKSLDNIKYVGMTSTSGESVKGTVEDIFVNFTFEGIQTEGNILIKSEFTDEWTFVTSNSTWQINSEFDKSQNSEIRTERSSAAIMLVLDCSSSLADQFATAQLNAKGFIKTLFEAAGMTLDPENPTDPSEGDVTLYSTTPLDLSLAIWKDGKRYYLTTEQYAKANLKGAVIEGLTIIGGGESFILSMQDIQTDPIKENSTAKMMYRKILPTSSQARIISAKWDDVNSALRSFGGSALLSGRYYYTQSTVEGNGYYYSQTNLLHGSGGSLYESNSDPFIRGVVLTKESTCISWGDKDDLKLSVILEGQRMFVDKIEYNNIADKIEKVEGVLIVSNSEKFILSMKDAQSSSIDEISTAKQLYYSIMPTVTQAKIISAKWSDVNSALTSFGGSTLLSGRYYYTKSTSEGTGYYFSRTNLLYGSGGFLSESNSVPYVRGVITLESGE